MTKKLSPLVVKLIVLSILLLVSSIPRLFVDGLISERKIFEAQATDSVVTGWAAHHRFGVVELKLPYTYRNETIDGTSGKTKYSRESEIAELSPGHLDIQWKDRVEILKRGIFEIPIYKADVAMSGEFVVPKNLAVSRIEKQWTEHQQTLLFVTKQVGAITEYSLTVNGSPRTLKRTSDGLLYTFSDDSVKPGETIRFQLNAKLNGYNGVEISTRAEDLSVSMTSAWPNPSFRGQLPAEKDVRVDGFSAKWKFMQPDESQAITVDFIKTVDIYSQADRALKYGFLMTLLCLSVLFLMETISNLSIHGMQYLLMSLPLSIFYVLLIALAEHIGFNTAYLIACVAVIALMTTYFAGTGASKKQCGVMGSVLTVVYGLILTMLSSEDYALLIGAISLFLCLAAFMLLTRRFDWSMRPKVKEAHV